MEKQIALLLTLLLYSPFFAFAVSGTAKAFPSSLPFFPCPGSSRGSFQHTTTVYSARASDTLWANGTACGKHYCVVCTGGVDSGQTSPCSRKAYTIVVIETNCPNCEASITISRKGFEAIADPNIGNIIKIEYSEIENLDFACA